MRKLYINYQLKFKNMRKKFTMLLAALLACAGVWAQTVLVNKPLDEIVASSIEDTEKAVFIKNAGRVVDNSTDWYWKSLTTESQIDGVKTTDPENNASKYLILEREEGVYDIYSLAEAKYVVTEATGNSANCVKLVDEVGTIQGWKIVDNSWAGKNDFDVTESNAYDLIPSSINLTEREDAGTQGTTPSANYNGGVLYNNLGTWNANDANSAWAFQQVVSAYTVTYNLKFLGETAKTITVEVLPGAEYPEIDLPYGITATKPEGNVNGNVVCDVECTLSGELPFQFATDYNSIEHWYYLNIRDDAPTYMYYDSSVEYIKATESSVPSNSKDAYTWAFVGNPFAGFSIVNYAAGETMVLSAPTAPTGDKNAAELARMVAKVGATGNLVWTILKPTHTNKNPAPVEGSFYVQHPTATTYAFNRQDYNSIKTVCYWSDRDTGSDLQVVERPMGPVAELAALIEEIEAAGIVCGTNPGEYTEASVNNLNAAVATAKTVGSSATESDLNALQAAYDALAVNPITAGMYRIVSANSGFSEQKGITCYAHDEYYGNRTNPGWAAVNENDPLQYWVLEDAGNGTFNLKAAYEGNYITTATSMSEVAKAATFTLLGKAQFNITLAGDDKPLHCYGWNWQNTTQAALTTYAGSADSPSAWKLIAVTETPEFTYDLTVGEVGYATLMLAYNATFPTTVACYTAAVDGEYVKLTEVEGNVLPAKTPVIVAAEAGTYSFVSTTATAVVSAENELVGSLYPQIVTPDANTTCYVLAKPAAENPVGFYKAALNQSDNAAFLNNANKVYLPVAAGAEAPAMFSFGRGEGTTGIETAVSGEQTVVIYDLAGRRVEKMEKGIYIVNGKKVIR